MNDTLAVARKEWLELLGQRGMRGKQGIVLFVAAFGVVLPLMNGPTWVTSPLVALAWSWVPMFLVSTVIADAFAGERERHTLETLLASRLPEGAILAGKIVAAIGYGAAMTGASLVAGVITVNVAHRGGGLLFYAPQVLEMIIVLGLLSSLFVAALGVFISLRAATVRQAQQTLGAAVMVLLLVPMGAVKLMPAAWRPAINAVSMAQAAIVGVALFAALDAGLLALAMKQFRRDRLIAD